MSLQPRPEVRGMKAGQHGGIDYSELARLGIAPEEILDFSANLNPFGPPLEISEVLHKADISSYPDLESTSLKHILGKKLGYHLHRLALFLPAL